MSLENQSSPLSIERVLSIPVYVVCARAAGGRYVPLGFVNNPRQGLLKGSSKTADVQKCQCCHSCVA